MGTEVPPHPAVLSPLAPAALPFFSFGLLDSLFFCLLLLCFITLITIIIFSSSMFSSLDSLLFLLKPFPVAGEGEEEVLFSGRR